MIIRNRKKQKEVSFLCNWNNQKGTGALKVINLYLQHLKINMEAVNKQNYQLSEKFSLLI